MVKEPTRQDRILDLFMTTHSSLVVQNIVCPAISDHDGIPLIDMKTKPATGKQKRRKMFLFCKANMNELTLNLKTVSDKTAAQSKQPNIMVDDLWNTFKSDIYKAMDTHIPSKLSSSKYRTLWINQRIRHELRRKQRSYNRVRKSNLPADWETFRKLRKHVQKKTKKSYWEYVRKTCFESPKKSWKRTTLEYPHCAAKMVWFLTTFRKQRHSIHNSSRYLPTSQGFFRVGLGVPPSSENFVNPSPIRHLSLFLDQGLSPQPRFVPENLKNLNTFLCQSWLLLS